MSEDILCSCSHVAVKGVQGDRLEEVSLSVRKKEAMALISEDDSAGMLLKLMAGLYVPDRGKIVYPGLTKQEITGFPKKIQYVPDDIVCYAGLRVREFLHGMAGGNEEMEANRERLVSAFGIDENETLLEMTFEQNRLVSIIQAMMAKPALLFMDRPYDMLRDKTYRLLLKEMIAQYMEGTAIVIAAQSYEDVVLPCNQYLFLENGRVKARHNRNELPTPSKVVTIWGGKPSDVLPENIEMLARSRRYCRFLYREQNMQELALCLSKTGCDNFNIEELTMEEELFGNYERWLP